jgi:hypothetical protein
VGRRAAAGGMDGRGLGTRERVMSPLTMIDRHNISHHVPFLEITKKVNTHRSPFTFTRYTQKFPRPDRSHVV